MLPVKMRFIRKIAKISENIRNEASPLIKLTLHHFILSIKPSALLLHFLRVLILLTELDLKLCAGSARVKNALRNY